MLCENSITIVLIFFVSVAATSAYGENIKGYSDCDVCPGSIHYGPDESRKLLGKEGFEAIARLEEAGDVSINLIPGSSGQSPELSDKAGPVRVHGNSLVLYIQDTLDGSYVQIATDYFQASQRTSMQTWHPEIFAQAAKAESIQRTDSIDQGWNKFRRSNIYNWVMDDYPAAAWNHALRLKLLQVLDKLGSRQQSAIRSQGQCSPEGMQSPGRVA